MAPLDRTAQQNKPFKQRKSFGGSQNRNRRSRSLKEKLTGSLFSLRSYQKDGGGGDPVQIPEQDPGECPVRLWFWSWFCLDSPGFPELQVIIERYEKEKFLPPLDKTKFLVPHELTMTQFVTIIRSRMALLPSQAFYLLVDSSGLASLSLTMAQVYKEHQDDDGFLYMTYASQEMFGL
uniref:Microtubule-associated protein 1 light chain 3 gamma, like n=1 Tax=Poecilia mexicana TaxID=48701 RepID=A0A3B3X1X4_9TELE